jgi:hypothetical protein
MTKMANQVQNIRPADSPSTGKQEQSAFWTVMNFSIFAEGLRTY